MKISELKRGQKLRHITSGEICKVSKKWNGCYLINPVTKKAIYKLNPMNLSDEFSGWETVA